MALVVLNKEYVAEWAASQTPPAARSDILLDPTVKVQVLLDMKRVAVEHGLKDYEHIKVRSRVSSCCPARAPLPHLTGVR